MLAIKEEKLSAVLCTVFLYLDIVVVSSDQKWWCELYPEGKATVCSPVLFPLQTGFSCVDSHLRTVFPTRCLPELVSSFRQGTTSFAFSFGTWDLMGCTWMSAEGGCWCHFGPDLGCLWKVMASRGGSWGLEESKWRPCFQERGSKNFSLVTIILIVGKVMEQINLETVCKCVKEKEIGSSQNGFMRFMNPWEIMPDPSYRHLW